MTPDDYRKLLPAFSSNEEERAYWHSRTPEERLEALEIMRRIEYGYDEAPPFEWVLEIGSLDDPS